MTTLWCYNHCLDIQYGELNKRCCILSVLPSDLLEPSTLPQLHILHIGLWVNPISTNTIYKQVVGRDQLGQMCTEQPSQP